MSDKEKQILNELLAKFDKLVKECDEKKQFLMEHNFDVEGLLVDVRRDAYHMCLRELRIAFYDIENLKEV